MGSLSRAFCFQLLPDGLDLLEHLLIGHQPLPYYNTPKSPLHTEDGSLQFWLDGGRTHRIEMTHLQ